MAMENRDNIFKEVTAIQKTFESNGEMRLSKYKAPKIYMLNYRMDFGPTCPVVEIKINLN